MAAPARDLQIDATLQALRRSTDEQMPKHIRMVEEVICEVAQRALANKEEAEISIGIAVLVDGHVLVKQEMGNSTYTVLSESHKASDLIKRIAQDLTPISVPIAAKIGFKESCEVFQEQALARQLLDPELTQTLYEPDAGQGVDHLLFVIQPRWENREALLYRLNQKDVLAKYGCVTLEAIMAAHDALEEGSKSSILIGGLPFLPTDAKILALSRGIIHFF